MPHGLKRDILSRLNLAGDTADILFREETFGNNDKEHDVDHYHDQSQRQHEAGMPQCPAEASFIGMAQQFKDLFAGIKQRAVQRPRPFSGRSRMAHIMGVVVRDITREIRMAAESVTANSRNKRPTMPPINKSGNKHRYQGKAHGDHRKGDLPCPQKGRL